MPWVSNVCRFARGIRRLKIVFIWSSSCNNLSVYMYFVLRGNEKPSEALGGLKVSCYHLYIFVCVVKCGKRRHWVLIVIHRSYVVVFFKIIYIYFIQHKKCGKRCHWVLIVFHRNCVFQNNFIYIYFIQQAYLFFGFNLPPLFTSGKRRTKKQKKKQKERIRGNSKNISLGQGYLLCPQNGTQEG